MAEHRRHPAYTGVASPTPTGKKFEPEEREAFIESRDIFTVAYALELLPDREPTVDAFKLLDAHALAAFDPTGRRGTLLGQKRHGGKSPINTAVRHWLTSPTLRNYGALPCKPDRTPCEMVDDSYKHGYVLWAAAWWPIGQDHPNCTHWFDKRGQFWWPERVITERLHERLRLQAPLIVFEFGKAKQFEFLRRLGLDDPTAIPKLVLAP